LSYGGSSRRPIIFDALGDQRELDLEHSP
jgi:hypothetical protein